MAGDISNQTGAGRFGYQYQPYQPTPYQPQNYQPQALGPISSLLSQYTPQPAPPPPPSAVYDGNVGGDSPGEGMSGDSASGGDGGGGGK